MAKAQDEAQALEHMRVSWKQSGGKLSGRSRGWVEAKVHALNLTSGVVSMLDLGIGDQDHLREWPPFASGDLYYEGVDGCPDILAAAQERSGGLERHVYLHLPFSTFVEGGEPTGVYDLVAALDVLYHIPDAELAQQLLDRAAAWSGRYLLYSEATDPSQAFDKAQHVGQPGFAWFPHKLTRPEGFRTVQTWDAPTLQRQRMLLLERV